IATPNSVATGGTTLLTVTVTGGTAPYTVTGNLSNIGGSATQTFFDNGTNGDVTPGDGIFSYAHTVPCNFTPFGPESVSITVTDSASGSVNPSVTVTITDGTLVLGLPSPGGAAPADDGQPSSQTRCAGETASFSVAAQGGGLTYQWFNGA